LGFECKGLEGEGPVRGQALSDCQAESEVRVAVVMKSNRKMYAESHVKTSQYFLYSKPRSMSSLTSYGAVYVFGTESSVDACQSGPDRL
jgi:hypothetical protein